jgi:hypothetical protein
MASHRNHLHGRRGRGFDAAGWHGSWLVKARRCLFCWVVKRTGTSRKPPSCWHGGRSTRPWWDSLRRVGVRRVGVRKGVLCFGIEPHPCRHGSRSTREVWDVLRLGGLWHVPSRFVLLGSVVARFFSEWLFMETKLVQARGRINAGGLGCTVVGYVVSSCVLAGRCQSMPVEFGFVVARFRTAIAVGAVRLRRLVAGCVWLRPGRSRYGGASPVLVRINPPS